MKMTDSNPNMFKDAAKDLKKVPKVIVKAVSALKNSIHTRTLAGKDVNNRTFRAYNPDYKNYKIEEGKSGRVNLSFFANMIDSMRVKQIKGGGIIHFNDTAENDKACYNEDMGRTFFGFDKRWSELLMRKINRAILHGK